MIVRRGLAIVLSLVLSAAALALAPSATAGDGEPAKDINPCSSGATVKLRVAISDNARLLAAGTVWSNDDDTWSWKFKHDGDVSFDGDVQAKDEDKSFKIVRKMVDFSGPDTIVFRAENNSTGEVCRVEVTF